MNQLIAVNYNSDKPTVSARELHEFLQVKTQYKDWFPRMVEYGFAEGEDFRSFLSESTGGRPAQDAEVTIDMAKEICMLQRNEKGKQARQYFIQLEKDWNSPEKVMARALQIADRKIHMLQSENTVQKQIIGELQPKASYYDTVLENKSLVGINQIAKDYGMSGQRMNKLLHKLGIQYKQGDQWLLYSKYHSQGYTHSKTTTITHTNGTTSVKLLTKWTQKGRLFLYEQLKAANILPVIERGKAS